jgi:Fur family transcriptional regulator, zinc uptake regulator
MPSYRARLFAMVARNDISALLRSAEETASRAGARFTRLRRNVLAVVAAADHPLSAYEILDRLRPGNRGATPAAVYRSLDFLIELGLVHRIESAKAFIACALPDHTHTSQLLVCRRCGTAVETEDAPLAQAAAHLSRRLGFALDHGTMELTGLCATCRR